MRRVLLVLAIAGCGVRAPAPVDVAALVKAQGPEVARRTLVAATLDAPRDVGAHLALATLDDQLGRPSDAIAELERVENLGGPAGIRWHDDDRARLARLILARGRARLARAAGSAAADLERAQSLGATVPDEELRRAHVAAAIADLRHVDAEVRERGRRVLAFLDEPRWHGARPNATAAERGAFGVWLWSVGAKVAAWRELSVWHDATPGARDAVLLGAYLSARTWWTPRDIADGRAAPDGGGSADLAGPERCRFGGCTAVEVAAHDDAAEVHALLAAPARQTTDPDAVVAWIQIGLRATLRDGRAWGPIVRAHVDVGALAAHGFASIPPHVRPILARMVDRDAAIPPPGDLPIDRLVVAAEHVLAGHSLDVVRATLGPVGETDDGRALVALVAPVDPVDDARAQAIVMRVRGRLDDAPAPAVLRPIVDAFARDPAIAERLGRELVARSADAAFAHAVLGALFEALEDPNRARANWQAAADASPEPAFTQGLAEIVARAGDPDAALIAATTAAAAAGDPAPVWTAVARAMHDAGSDVHALEAAKSAIDLAGPDAVDAALEVAIAASRTLQRDAQADMLARRLAAPPLLSPDDPTDVAAAFAAYRAEPSSSRLARLWVASRWNPRDVASRALIVAETAPTDPRHAPAIAELVGLAGDRAVGAEALRALR